MSRQRTIIKYTAGLCVLRANHDAIGFIESLCKQKHFISLVSNKYMYVDVLKSYCINRAICISASDVLGHIQVLREMKNLFQHLNVLMFGLQSSEKKGEYIYNSLCCMSVLGFLICGAICHI